VQSRADNAQQFYDTHSEDYASKWSRIDADPGRPSHVYRKEMINTLIEIAGVHAGERVVEIGCGTGLVLDELLKRTRPVWGTDISIEMLHRAREALAGARVEIVPTVEGVHVDADLYLVRDDFLSLSLPHGAFDKILSMEVLRYVGDLRRALRNVCDVMDDDTVFAFTHTNIWSTSLFPVKYSLRKKLRRVDAGNELVQYFVTERALRRALRESSLRVVETRKLNFLTFSPPGRWLAGDRRGAERLIAFDRVIEKVPVLNRAFDTLLFAVKRA
jgi:SAM-dependent methyltransferase